MNDLERDLRTLLDEKAVGAGAPMPDARLLRRARRRQVGTVLGGAAVALVVVAGVVVAVSAFGRSDRRTPAEPGDRLVETTVNGITVTHPENWFVVDPTEVGIESEDGRPNLVLLLSPLDPATLEELAWCPGSSDGLLMTIQEAPSDLAGGAAQPWPADLVPMDTAGLGAAEIGSSGCFPEWTFLTSNWTDNGRTFEAFVAYGPAVSDEDRDSLKTAFASMRFAPSGGYEEATVIATGTAGGEDWELIATNLGDGLTLDLQSSTGGSGFGVGSEQLSFQVGVLGEGQDREMVVYGLTRPPVVGIEYHPSDDWPAVSTSVIDIPDTLDDGYDAFVFTYPAAPFDGKVRGVDAEGRVVTTAGVVAPLESPEPAPFPEGVEIASGEDWSLRIDDRSGRCITILVGDGSKGSCTDTDEFWEADVITLQDRSVVYGFVRPETDRVLLRLENGTTLEGSLIAPPKGFAYQVEVFTIELDGTSGTGRISLLDDTGSEIGSADIEWAPGSSDVVYER